MATATATPNQRHTPFGGGSQPALMGVPGPEFRSYEEGDYVVYEDVPVWCEHYSRLVGKKFGPSELAQVTARCNERITETGDYSPLVLRHTKEAGDNTPPVVGLAGPFKMGRIGNKKPKAAILARMRFRKEDIDQVKRHPRVSVEYWFSPDDPTNGFFDPISLLGAETPELDLGLRYSKEDAHAGEKCIRYHRTVNFGDPAALNRADYAADAAPGGANTFIPGQAGTAGDPKRRKPDGAGSMDSIDYDRDGQQPFSGPLNALALAQMVAAMRPVIKEIVMEMVPAPQPPSPEQNEIAEQFSADGAGDASDANNMGALAGEGSAGAGDDVAGAGLPRTDSAPAVNGLGDASDESMGDPGSQDGDSGRDAAAGGGSKSKSPKPKQAEAEDMADSNTSKGKAKYSAELSGELTKIVGETPANLKAADSVVARYEKFATQSIAKIDALGASLDTITAERDMLKANYEKASRESGSKSQEIAELTARVGVIEADARHNARYAKLQDLVSKDGYTFDIEEELKDFAAVDDATFDKHIERIKKNFQRVPMRGLPLASGRHEGPGADEPTEEERALYAKEAAEEAYQAKQRGDRSVTFGTALLARYEKAKKKMPSAF
jgi:hypothetical protein